MSIRKFYDVAAPEAPAGSGAAVTDLASIMAKSGRLSQPGNEGAIPKINTTEKKEEPTPASAPAPATATQAQPAEQAKPESPKPTEAPQAAKPQTEEPAKVPSWQEVLKQQQPNAIFKELGFGDQMASFLSENKELDPKMLNLIKYWKENGNVEPFLKALSTDYGKMAPEDVMRHQLQMQNLELDAKQLETLYKVKVVQRYKLDPALNSEEDVEEGRIELMADVKSIRQGLIAEQQNYLVPKAPEAKPSGPDPVELQRQQDNEAYIQEIRNDPYSQSLVTNNKLVIGEGDDKFEFPINSQVLSEVMFNGEALGKRLNTADGKPDTAKQWLISAIAEYGMGFMNAYAQHFKTLGGKSAIAPIENAKPPGAGAPAHAEVESTNPAAVMAKRGRITRGGDN